MKELINRIKAETPIFWKKAQTAALSFGGSALAVITANTSFGLNLNPTVISVLGYVVAVCAAVAGTAQLTKN